MRSFRDFSSMLLSLLHTCYLRIVSICTINELNPILKNHSFRLLPNASDRYIFDNSNACKNV